MRDDDEHGQTVARNTHAVAAEVFIVIAVAVFLILAIWVPWPCLDC